MNNAMRRVATASTIAAVAALCIFDFPLAVSVSAAILAIALLVWTRQRKFHQDPLHYCAGCGRCLGSRKEGIEVPCPECGGKEFFTLEREKKREESSRM